MDRKELSTLALASQLGFSIAGPLVLGGIFLDKKVGSSPLFLLIGIACGLIGAGYAMYDLVRKLPSNRRRPPDSPGGTR
jgi:F0F1-type ATP synthase assembly protein I